MGLIDRIVKDVKGVPMNRILEQERIEQEIRAAELYNQQMGGNPYTGGQPLPPQSPIVMPPTFEKETMELYLIPKIPDNLDELQGTDKYWPFIHSATTIITANLNAHRQKKILTMLRIATDFEGCDNVEHLVKNEMINVMAEVETDKARSDFADGMRERIVPAVGIGMTGAWNPAQNQAERPKESRAILGMVNRMRPQ